MPGDPLPRLIDLLRQITHAPVAKWFGLSQEITALPRVGTEAGHCAAMLASAARTAAKQAPYITPSSETEMRGLCQGFAVMLQNEVNAVLGEKARPYYAREA